MVDDLRTKVAAYLREEITLTELEEWLTPRLPRLYEQDSDRALLGTLELGLAELDNGTATEAELREQLRECMKGYSWGRRCWRCGQNKVVTYYHSSMTSDIEYNYCLSCGYGWGSGGTAQPELPRVDPRNDNLNDLWAWGEEVARRAGLTEERSKELLQLVREFLHSEHADRDAK